MKTCGPLSLILLYYNVNNLHLLFIASVDKDIDPCCFTYYIKELDFLVIIPGIGIDHPAVRILPDGFTHGAFTAGDAPGETNDAQNDPPLFEKRPAGMKLPGQ